MQKKHHKRYKGVALSLPRLTTIVFVLLFGVVGSYLMFTGHAATSSYQLQLGSDRGLCMDNNGSSTASKNKIDIWACNNTMAQEWTFQTVSGGFLLVDGQGTCADDTGDGVGTSASNRVYLQTYSCNASDHAQVWKWNGQQLQNAFNSGCINDPVGSTTNGQQLIIFSCSPVASNAQWYKVAAPTPSVSITSPGGGATVSGTSVLISGKASVSPGSITSITLQVGGATLGSCANSTTCFSSWNSKSVGNGSYTVKVTATTSGGGTGQATETIYVNNAAPPPPPPPGGGGGTGSGGGSGGGTGSGGGGSGTGSGSGGSGGSSSGSGDGSGFGGGGDSGSGSVSVDSSGSDGSVSLGQPTDGGGSPDVTVSQAPDGSSVLSPNNQTGQDTGPTVFDIVSTNITKNSISLSWETGNANTYTVKFGTDPNKLTNTHTVKSSNPQPSLTISNLPSNTKIYISITPSFNGQNGATVSTSFTTLKSTSHAGAIVGWTIFLLVAVAAAVFIRRKLHAVAGDPYSVPVSQPTIDVQHMPIYPQEDSAAQAARVNWWLPEDQRQAIAHHQQPAQPQPQQPQAEQYPDMFEEGRRRLEEESKNRQIPGA